MGIIARVLQDHCFQAHPPVFMDVGASGPPPPLWQEIAKYSICIAFDADARDFVTEGAQGWKKRLAFQCIATADGQETDFYLTQFPHCSSTLAPDLDALGPWGFRPLFEVVDKVQLPAISLSEALHQAGVSAVDWLKLDTQGTDLRLFKSLPEPVQNDLLVVEFEPGILSAYHGEDKLYDVMATMDALPFWVSDMQVKGTQRITHKEIDRLSAVQRWDLNTFLTPSPGWCEIGYMTTMPVSTMTRRRCLLAWVFATCKGQYGFALNIAKLGKIQFDEVLFDDLIAASRRDLNRGYSKFLLSLTQRVGRKFFTTIKKIAGALGS